jgi:hypothetical protein
MRRGPAMIESELSELERGFWEGGADFYRTHLSADALMVLPEPAGVLARDVGIDSIVHSPRWTDVRMEDIRVIRLTADAAALVYRASARRETGNGAYAALVSSVYIREGGSWKLALHQQTPIGGD